MSEDRLAGEVLAFVGDCALGAEPVQEPAEPDPSEGGKYEENGVHGGNRVKTGADGSRRKRMELEANCAAQLSERSDPTRPGRTRSARS